MWQDPLVVLRFPKLFDLKADPFERAQTDAGDYARWRVEHAFALVPAQAFVATAPCDLPRLSATPKARQFLARSGAGQTPARWRREVGETT